ncbi:ankyrin repeat protein [Colletotrichum tofieldiae]|nr:ankyrin repeat protein [Colletotrichum tofieldiae]
MAEVLSIVEVALCIAEVVERLCAFVSTVRGAKDDMRKLTQELLALKGALDYFGIQHKKTLDSSLHEQVHSMLSMTQETLDAIQLKLGTPKASSVGRAVQSLTWPFRRAKTWFIMVLMRDSLDVTLSVFVEMQKLTALVHEEIIARRTDRMLDETAGLLKWLSPVNSEDKLVSSRQDRAPGTGNWIRDASYLAWQRGGPTQRPIYWITGRSGSGKTVLFSHLVDELRKRPNNHLSAKAASIGVGFHCCSLDDAASQAVPNVFGSILAQIGATTPDILDHVRPLRQAGNTLIPQNNLSVDQIHHVMGEALEHFDVFYLMIDALNETSHESLIVRALLTLCGRHSNLRVLLTCTREPLEDDPRIFVRHMNNNAIDLDIELYVENRLVTEHGFQSLSPNIRDEVKKKVVSDADGTSRGAHVALLLPPALRLDELAEAVVLEEGDADIDGDSRLTDPSIILEICQGLAHASDYFVTLAHDSIRTFLQSDWIRTSSVSEFAVDAMESHRRIMRKCLAYLHLEPFSSGPVGKLWQVNRRFAVYPLLNYATFMWPIHSERFPLSDHDEHLILGFFETKKLSHGGPFEAWVQFLLHSTNTDVIRETEPVYYAASFNMTSVLQLILRPEYEVDVNKRGGRYSSPPLFVAIWRRNIEAARLLLEAGANPDMWDTSGQTSRLLATGRKMHEIVDLMDQITLRASTKAAGEDLNSPK